MLKKRLEGFYPIISVLLFVAVWYIAALAVSVEMILPSPSSAFRDFFALLGKSDFWLAVLNTLKRSLLSFSLSFVIALILAAFGSFFKFIHKIVSPLVTITRSTPTMSVILLAVIWLTSENSPVLISSLIIFPLLYDGFYGAFCEIGGEFKVMSDIYNVPLLTRLKDVYIPGVLPTVFTLSKSGISLTVKIMIAAEVIAQTRSSMGNFMQLSRIYLNTSELLAWTLAAVILSFVLETVVMLTKKLVVRWK